jgi:adenosylmethionine-8-amino-7-oxononanoate aminotransferase
MSALWHPFADMSLVAGREVVVARGEGVWVWDEEGRRYLDGSASLWYCNVGHGRREILDAIRAQLEQLEAYHVFGDVATRPALDLAERLSALAPDPGSKVFLTSGGADSIEAAAKLARLFHASRGEPGRRHLISRERAYHGTHGIATSILGMPYRAGFEPLVQETSQVAHDSVDALDAEIQRLGAETVAAVVFEPVIGAGGVHLPPAGYLESVEELCRAHGILTIADAVICGFGRLGTWFGVERHGLRPDLIVFAKGVTSGYLPLGGVIAAPSVASLFWEREGIAFYHGPTYSGHATCCAAALANIDLLEQDDLVGRAQRLEADFFSCVAALSSHELVGEVRGGVGLMAGVGLEPALLEAMPGASGRLLELARDHGLLTRRIPDGVALAPPLIVEDEQVDFAVDALRRALDELRAEA